MRKRTVPAALVTSVLCLGVIAPAAAQCVFQPWMTFKGTQLLRHEASGAYIYVTQHKAVDADGAPNAYHPDDIGKHCHNDPHLGLDCPANAGLPETKTDWWDSVVVPDPNNPSKAFRQPAGEFEGFYIAMTWLTDGSKAATDIQKYVDSRTVPYLVMPGSQFPNMSGTGSRGDVGIAWNDANGESTAFIIADKGGGNDAELGEGSIGLFKALGYPNPNPRTGAGLDNKPVRYLVFAGSRKDTHPDWPQSLDAIEEHAERLLEGIGGEATLEACF
jgi:hypothetical protein